MITKSQYLANPCRAASLPYWKAKSMVLPEEILIVHDDDFRPSEYAQYTDEPYFSSVPQSETPVFSADAGGFLLM